MLKQIGIVEFSNQMIGVTIADVGPAYPAIQRPIIVRSVQKMIDGFVTFHGGSPVRAWVSKPVEFDIVQSFLSRAEISSLAEYSFRRMKFPVSWLDSKKDQVVNDFDIIVAIAKLHGIKKAKTLSW